MVSAGSPGAAEMRMNVRRDIMKSVGIKISIRFRIYPNKGKEIFVRKDFSPDSVCPDLVSTSTGFIYQ
jgi:hypothetical protein